MAEFRRFARCVRCSLIRLCTSYGGTWLCDTCVEQMTADELAAITNQNQ